jgi:uncharacterized protein (TIGR02145 family)
MKRALTALLGIIVFVIPAAVFAGNCGDVNNNGPVNILDITYLINYVYRGGPEPDCGPIGTVTDIDGNIYLTIKIGDQWWMMENLKVTHYRNGEPIPNVTDPGAWGGLTTGAYCEYDNDIANVDAYGRLYNWYAVDDSRNIAPAGWHVPSDAEWQTLIDYLGGSGVAGGKMKEAGTAHWDPPNSGATNESGLTALPDGYRNITGNYSNMGINAMLWSSSEYNVSMAQYRYLIYNAPGVFSAYTDKAYGFSVRCVRD